MTQEYDPTLQSPSERRSLLSQGILRLRRLFVQVANITILRTDTITERTPAAGVTVDDSASAKVLIKDGAIHMGADPTGVTGTKLKDDASGLRIRTGDDSANAAFIAAAGVFTEAAGVGTDIVDEVTSGAGVTIDGLLIKDNFIEHEEIPTPANPALNNLRLFARASGANIQLIALSSQGAECVICTLDDTAVAHTNTLALNLIE